MYRIRIFLFSLSLSLSLSSQTYRHVDNVMFDDGSVVDRFIEGWRRSGQQKIGYLIGQYQEYSDVPLGIRAVVSAIYEPPQVIFTLRPGIARIYVYTCKITTINFFLTSKIFFSIIIRKFAANESTCENFQLHVLVYV